jgi:hypothetical protein
LNIGKYYNYTPKNGLNLEPNDIKECKMKEIENFKSKNLTPSKYIT